MQKKINMSKLVRFYEDKLGADGIYEWIVGNKLQSPIFKEFLPGVGSRRKSKSLIKAGKLKTDLPVWFGNPNAGNDSRIMVVGQAPHDHRPHLDIARIGATNFGCIFAATHWRKKGEQVEDKICQRYPMAFCELLEKAGHEKIFTLFTDMFKTVDHNDKPLGEEKRWKNILMKEIKIVKPCVVIALGKKVCCKLNEWHIQNVMYVRHPARNAPDGKEDANKQIGAILRLIFPKKKFRGEK